MLYVISDEPCRNCDGHGRLPGHAPGYGNVPGTGGRCSRCRGTGGTLLPLREAVLALIAENTACPKCGIADLAYDAEHDRMDCRAECGYVADTPWLKAANR